MPPAGRSPDGLAPSRAAFFFGGGCGRTFFFGRAQPALYSGFAFGSAAGWAGAGVAAELSRREAFDFDRNWGRSPVGRLAGSICSANCSRTTRGPTSSISPTPSVPSARGP